MRVTANFFAAVVLLSLSAASRADWIAQQVTLADLSKAGTTTFVRSNTSVVKVTSTPAGPVATLNFLGHYSSFGQDFSTGHDWSQYNIVDVSVRNYETRVVNFKFIAQLYSDPNNYNNAYTGAFYVNPGSTRHFLFYLNTDDPGPFGFKYLNPVLSADAMDVFQGSGRNLAAVWHWRLSLQDNLSAKVDVSSLRLIRQALNFTGISDKFGQYTDRVWPSKIYATTDFAPQLTAEKADIASHPGTGETQGTTKVANPKPVAGKWAVITLANGRKFLQHPNGKLFWSLGLNSVNDSLATRTQDRSSYFQYLPPTTGTYASCYSVNSTPAGSKTCYSFRKQNLMMKYGSSYTTPWVAMVKSRLASWGFNTLGMDTMSSFLNGSIPFTIQYDTSGFATRFRPPSMKWGSLPDPYAAGFFTYCKTKFAGITSYTANTNFMGVFVDNEMSWGNMDSNAMRYNLALGALKATPSQPAKTAFVNQLRTKYVTISALNTSWKTNFASWDGITSNTTWLPTTYSTGMAADFQAYCTAYAKQYYYQVLSALSSDGLKSLYLGSRYADYTTEVVNAAASYVNILSFNFYKEPWDVPWSYLNGLAKPVLISEFATTLRGWGTFGGPVPMPGAGGRAARVQGVLDNAIAQPNVIGAHYYCYADQPITGRWSDYENGGFGMVDVADAPYVDSVNVLRTFSQNMYLTRAGATGSGWTGTANPPEVP